jgi:pimeloyl-ACP methyl ester carboxylesterase
MVGRRANRKLSSITSELPTIHPEPHGFVVGIILHIAARKVVVPRLNWNWIESLRVISSKGGLRTVKFNPWTFLATCFPAILLFLLTSVSQAEPSPGPDTPEAAFSRIRAHIKALLSKPQPELFARHLKSVLALSEEDVLKLELAGADKDERAKELHGYLSTIEAGLNGDGERAEPYLVSGRCSLTLARLSQSDGTLQFYTVSLPTHWDSHKAYPLYVQLHGRGPDIPLAYISYTFQPAEENEAKNADLITIVPWLRGNGEWRNENGSEPDIWEAIEDVKSFATIDPNRWYLSGHSWGGDDAWSIAQRTPDLWAAVGIMAGNPVGAPYALGLVANANNVPFYLWVGDEDKERKSSFDNFRTSLTAVGNPPKVVVAAGVGHNYRADDAAALEAWLMQHTRRMPKHFSFVVDTPQHRGIWGVSIPRIYPDAYPQAEPRVKFECWIEGSSIRIRTWDAKQIEVNLGSTGLNLSGKVELIVNGKTRFSGVAPGKPLSLNL